MLQMQPSYCKGKRNNWTKEKLKFKKSLTAFHFDNWSKIINHLADSVAFRCVSHWLALTYPIQAPSHQQQDEGSR